MDLFTPFGTQFAMATELHLPLKGGPLLRAENGSGALNLLAKQESGKSAYDHKRAFDFLVTSLGIDRLDELLSEPIEAVIGKIALYSKSAVLLEAASHRLENGV